jgi:hypothetical protein
MKSRKAITIISAFFLMSVFLILTRSAAMGFVAAQNFKVVDVILKTDHAFLKNRSPAIISGVGDKLGFW